MKLTRPLFAFLALNLMVLPAIAMDAAAQTTTTEKDRWLNGKLYGHDNNMAALRPLKLSTQTDGTYQLYIPNQMTFLCELRFNAEGFPALLRNCLAQDDENKDWKVKEAEVSLTCKTHANGDVVCQGPYTLTNGTLMSDRAHFTVARKP